MNEITKFVHKNGVFNKTHGLQKNWGTENHEISSIYISLLDGFPYQFMTLVVILAIFLANLASEPHVRAFGISYLSLNIR